MNVVLPKVAILFLLALPDNTEELWGAKESDDSSAKAGSEMERRVARPGRKIGRKFKLNMYDNDVLANSTDDVPVPDSTRGSRLASFLVLLLSLDVFLASVSGCPVYCIELINSRNRPSQSTRYE